MTSAVRIEAVRRRAPRTNVHVEVTFQSDHHIFLGLSENISQGGVFVATHTLLEVGTMVDLELTVPGHGDRIRTIAVVRWVRLFNETSDGPPGMGLQFASIDGAGRTAIRRFLEARPAMFWDL